MKLLLDAQLSPKVGQALNASGYTTSLVREVNLRDSEDLDIWEYALTHGFVIVTKDIDFVVMSRTMASGPPIVWLRIGNCSNAYLVSRLLPLLAEIEERVNCGDRLIEVS